MIKHQQMQWSQRGAHLLLQIRTRVLNEEWEDTFRRWYPGFRPHTEEPVLDPPPDPGIECSPTSRVLRCLVLRNVTVPRHELVSQLCRQKTCDDS